MILLMLYCAVLAVLWMCLMSTFTFPMFVTGYLVGAVVVGLYYAVFYVKIGRRPILRKNPWHIRKLPDYLILVVVFAWELIKANVAVLKQVFSPKMDLKPGIIAMPIDLDSDAQITLLANMITLTPGTISAEISPQNDIIYIHALDASDPEGVIEGINKAFTRRIKGARWHELSAS